MLNGGRRPQAVGVRKELKKEQECMITQKKQKEEEKIQKCVL
jgi:hypothetical protein